jgi:hypothetical protein
MAKCKTWIITTSSERPIDEISKDLQRAGLVVRETLSEIGCIVGSASEEAVAKLRKVPGVANVSQDSSVDVGPPGSSDTW